MPASNRKHVLIIVENLSVPFDRRVWQEAVALTRAGYHVVAICPQGLGSDGEEFELIDEIEIHRYPLSAETTGVISYLQEYPTALWRTWRLTRRVQQSQDFSVVHVCNPPDFLFLPALAVRRRGAALIFDQHDLVPELYLSRFRRNKDLGYKLTLLMERVAFALADVVLATNESYRAVAMARGRISPDNVFVVRNAPDPYRFHAAPPLQELRKGKKHLLAYVGVMNPQDGADHGLRALAELRRRRDDWHAVFIGSGDAFETLRTLRDQLNLDGFVEFTGRVPDETLLQVLSTADIGLAPDPLNPLNERSTMVKVVEYMALGLPLVSYDLPETRVSAGEAAAYAPPNDPVAFADQIDKLLDAPGRRAAMGTLGKRRLAEGLSWEHSCRELLRAYGRAVEVRTRSA